MKCRIMYMAVLLVVMLFATQTLQAQQDFDKTYFPAIEKLLSDGDCEGAEEIYRVYQGCSGHTNSNMERRIAECRRNKSGQAASPPATTGSKRTFTVNGVSFNMVYVRGGVFTMGCTGEQGNECDNDEKPVHPVTLTDYYMGETEVTVGLFRQFVGETGYRTDAEKEGWAWRWMEVDGELQWNQVTGFNWLYDAAGNARSIAEDTHPVLYVSWNDANEFCKWLSRRTGRTFRLPTEAEWEYAARGGAGSRGYKYSGGNDIGAVAWHDGNSGGKTHPVAQKQANELGLYDMSGNVWEWCSDWYGSDYYSSSPQNSPGGPSSGSNRVFRGGSWFSSAGYCRVSLRNYNYPAYRSNYLGFRLVLEP